MYKTTLTLLAAFATTTLLSAQTFQRLDPRGTYLRTNSDPAPDAVAIPLATIGVGGGQVIRIRRLGDLDNGPGGETYGTTIAVFTTSATLMPANQVARVPGAVDAGCDFATARTYFGQLATDIGEDFLVASGAGASATQDEVVVVVPASATHVFVCPHDSLYHDNSDPDGDYGVEFTVLAPTAWSTLGGGVAGTMGVPALTASGELVCGAHLDLTLTRARPLTPVLHVFGIARLDLPLFGGVLVPDPLIADVLVATDATGTAALRLPVPVRFPSGAALYVQAWLPDPAAAFRLAASDAVRGVAP